MRVNRYRHDCSVGAAIDVCKWPSHFMSYGYKRLPFFQSLNAPPLCKKTDEGIWVVGKNVSLAFRAVMLTTENDRFPSELAAGIAICELLENIARRHA